LVRSDQSEFRWLILPADLQSLPEFLEFVVQGAKDAQLSEEKLWKLELGLEEALVNVIHYAYPEGKAGTIRVGYRSEANGWFCVRICDGGQAFDPLSASPPLLTPKIEERPIGGLGIFLMRHVADEIRYRRKSGMNHLTLRFSP
jgi:serine/threonine-protein kinase RsbW